MEGDGSLQYGLNFYCLWLSSMGDRIMAPGDKPTLLYTTEESESQKVDEILKVKRANLAPVPQSRKRPHSE